MWFCKPFSVCADCGVHFEPLSKSSSQHEWAHLCRRCREPHVELRRRRDRVVEWARRNWQKLEAQVAEEEKAIDEAYSRSISQLQQSQMRGGGLGGTWIP